MANPTDYADYFSPQVVRTRRFFLPDWETRTPSPFSVALAGGGCEWCAPDFEVNRQSLPFHAFEFIARGRGTVVLSGREHPLVAGQAFLYGPQTPHRISAEPDEPMVKYFFNFTGPRACALLKAWHLPAGTVLHVPDAGRLVSLLEEVIDHSLQGSPAHLRIASTAFEHALAVCSGSLDSDMTKFDPAYSTYLRCRSHLLRNYPALTSITQAAANCRVSPAHFTRLFQKFDKETPLACLTRLKMSQAAIRLRQPRTQVKAVASELGYKSAAHFSRVFKAWHGQPPLAAMHG